MKTITADTLYLILPGKVSQLSMLIARKTGISILDAIRKVYRSNTYRDLSKEETKLWHLGPIALYEYFQEHN